MDINLLVIEVGHSRLKLGRFEAGELRFVKRIDVRQRENWEGAIEEAWRPIGGKANAEVAGAASNLGLLEAVEEAAQRGAGKRVQWVGIGRDLELPIAVETKRPQATGVDRVLNVAAAYEQLGKACCVVDAGSAVTIDFCDEKGVFLGGVIAPGLTAQAEALGRLGGLPVVRPGSMPEGAFGDDTESAIAAGLMHGIRGLVRQVVEERAMTLETWPELIATGGDAQLLFDGWELVHAISPDLTLYGLALAYTEHHIRRG